MRYRTRHVTTYSYGEPVSLCHNEVRLKPRTRPEQTLIDFRLDITPRPESVVEHADYYGNTAIFFCIHEPHSRLEIVAESVVDVSPEPAPAAWWTPAWEDARAQAGEDVSACQFVFDSQVIERSAEFAAYAEPSFPAGRSLLEAAQDLCRRIHADFLYQPYVTQVDTPVETALRNRRGVCQDFSHVMIACLRSMGLPARYVSGYIRSGENRAGADASHAWVSVYCPGFGWIGLDPTNDRMEGDGEHVTLAWGRDYADVSPMKGVMVGGGEHLVHVSVGVVGE